MGRYKDYNYDQMKMIAVSFERQILPGSFEYSLSYLIDHELDLTVFDQRYRNDDEYPGSVLTLEHTACQRSCLARAV